MHTYIPTLPTPKPYTPAGPSCFFCRCSLTVEVHSVTLDDGIVAACASCKAVRR